LQTSQDGSPRFGDEANIVYVTHIRERGYPAETIIDDPEIYVSEKSAGVHILGESAAFECGGSQKMFQRRKFVAEVTRIFVEDSMQPRDELTYRYVFIE
jgi:hypothetical protein